jgi:hypothetical protein
MKNVCRLRRFHSPFLLTVLNKRRFYNHIRPEKTGRDAYGKEMIHKFLLVCLAVLHMALTQAQSPSQDNWRPAGLKLPTRWTRQVSPTNALPEYPRPQMVRGAMKGSGEPEGGWQNLNGLWDYAITDSSSHSPAYMGRILVPYPIESALSGVNKTVQPNQHLWYRRMFNVPVHGANHRILLHFGAVDWQTTVFINGKEMGTHTGGYDHFSFDITDALKNGENELVVKVDDPTDQGPNPHGKQVLKPSGIWYTPTTGIWQTVWLETVPETYIESVQLTPDVDGNKVKVRVNVKGASRGDYTIVTSLGNKKNGMEWNTANIELPVKNKRLWSPSDPYLYDLYISVRRGGEELDWVKTYFGMRKVEIKKDDKGFDRIFLNNKYVFNLGVLDQGFWPDGLYTAPTDEALAFDIKAIRAMGFNTTRKHIKREPDRWYYWCDKLGIMVWQDMINPSFKLNDEAKKEFEKECRENITELYNHPSIITYTLFNEKWGQYDQERLTKWIKQLDPTRLVNGHSGEYLYVNEKLRSPSPNAYIESDLTDVHSYPDPMNALQLNGKARVVGEFGGVGVFIPDHQWNAGTAWGYVTVTPAQLKWKYTVMNQHLKLLEQEGLSASIYTQPFDVEGEQNGLMTYDREVVKIPFEELRKIHSMLVPTAAHLPKASAKNADLTEPAKLYAQMVAQYINGRHDAVFLKQLAMTAAQTNDAAGRNRFGAEYMASLQKPYSDEDLAFIEAATKKVTDPGFSVLLDRETELKGSEQRSLRTKLMNLIYQDLIAPYVSNARSKPDWKEIEEKIKPYGKVGEEVFLRAKTIDLYNKKDWPSYVPAATLYIEKYGSSLKPEELKSFSDAIEKNK